MSAESLSLQDQFFAESASVLDSLASLLAGETVAEADRYELARLLHSLCGAAATLGYESFARLARALQQHARQTTDVALLVQGITLLHEQLARLRAQRACDEAVIDVMCCALAADARQAPRLKPMGRRVRLRFQVGRMLVGVSLLWRRALEALSELGRFTGGIPSVEAAPAPSQTCELCLQTDAPDAVLENALASLAEPGSVVVTEESAARTPAPKAAPAAKPAPKPAPVPKPAPQAVAEAKPAPEAAPAPNPAPETAPAPEAAPQPEEAAPAASALPAPAPVPALRREAGEVMQIFHCAGYAFALPLACVHGIVAVQEDALWPTDAPARLPFAQGLLPLLAPQQWWPHVHPRALEELPPAFALVIGEETGEAALLVQVVAGLECFAADELLYLPEHLRGRWPYLAGAVQTHDGRRLWRLSVPGLLEMLSAAQISPELAVQGTALRRTLQQAEQTLAALQADVTLAAAKGETAQALGARVHAVLTPLRARLHTAQSGDALGGEKSATMGSNPVSSGENAVAAEDSPPAAPFSRA